MSEMFGATWSSSQGDEPNATWIIGLEDLDISDLRNGIQAVVHKGEKWPPTLPEFRAMCTGGTEGWERQCHRPADLPPLIEDKTTKEQKTAERKSMLAKLREETGI